jgi:hypothetical protein
VPDRPPVKFAGALPEGNLNGLGVILPAVLDDEELPVFFVGTARLRKKEHVVDTGVDWAVLRIVDIEVLTDGKIPAGHDTVAGLIAERRGERTGHDPLDFDGASDAEYAELADLRQRLADWQAEQGMSDVTLGEDVIATVPDAGVGWRDSPQIIRDYLTTKGAIPDPPAGEQP